MPRLLEEKAFLCWVQNSFKIQIQANFFALLNALITSEFGGDGKRTNTLNNWNYPPDIIGQKNSI